MNTLRSTFSVVICAKGHYSWVFATEGVVRLAEMLLIVVALLAFDARPVTVAAISCATTVLDFLIIMRLRRGLYDWARIDLRAWDRAWLKSLVRPSVGFWLSNLTTQSIMLQGPRVALGIVLGGEAVAIHSVFATVNRLTDQLVMLFSWPLQIEVAQSSQRQEFGQAYRLVTFATQVAWLLFIGAAAGLMLLGPSLFPYWTAGKIEFDHGLMALFLVMAAAAQIGRVSSQVLLGANRMFEPSTKMFLAGCGSLGLGSLLAWAFGLPGMLVGGIAGELALSILAVSAMVRWLGQDLRRFALDMMDLSTLRRWIGILAKRFVAPAA
jgi:O-antigen/teichoic acid export membrane protein